MEVGEKNMYKVLRSQLRDSKKEEMRRARESGIVED